MTRGPTGRRNAAGIAVDVGEPLHLSPKLRRASARSTHAETLTESSPVLVRTTSPVAPIQSPRERSPNSSKRRSS